MDPRIEKIAAYSWQDVLSKKLRVPKGRCFPLTDLLAERGFGVELIAQLPSGRLYGVRVKDAEAKELVGSVDVFFNF